MGVVNIGFFKVMKGIVTRLAHTKIIIIPETTYDNLLMLKSALRGALNFMKMCQCQLLNDWTWTTV